jgi:hypothetical protein
VAIAAAMLAVGIILANTVIDWITIVVLVVLAVILVLFHSLTVVISEDELLVQFGSGVIRKRFKLNEIESCQTVRIPWYYGWGIRMTPQGMVFRVSGFRAVQIRLTTGKEFLIGTDAPQELEEAIRQAQGYRSGLSQDTF